MNLTESLEQKRHRMTLEALQEIARGDFVEQAEIDAWLAGLPDYALSPRHRNPAVKTGQTEK